MNTGTLSGRERDVARCAATGATTRQIADELFISVRTVESHLGSIYRKLGVTNRAGLVATLAASNLIDADEPAPVGEVPGLTPAAHFVGRQAEIDRIAAAAADTRRSGSRVVLIGGESGIGKSSLLAAALETIRDEVPSTVFLTYCIEGLSTPFGPLADALQGYLRSQVDPLELVVGPDGGVLASLMPSIASRLPRLPEGIDPAAKPRLVVDSFRAVLEYAARRRPVVLILEDLHWVDRASVAFLRSMIVDATKLPILMIGTFRDTELVVSHPLPVLLSDLWKVPTVERINLGGLTLSDAQDLASALESGPSDPGVVAHLHDASAGNPLYLATLLREQHGATVAMRLPESIREAAAVRIARVDGDALAPLEVAAVTGLDFDLVVVESALERLGHTLERPVLEMAESARRGGLLEESTAVDADYRFVHDVLRQVLLEQIGKPRLARIHAAVGHARLDCHGADARTLPSVADHLARSNLAADRIEAAEVALRALRSGVSALAPDDAAQLAEAVLAHLPQGEAADATRFDLLIELIDIHYLRFDHDAHRRAAIDAAAIGRRRARPIDVAKAIAHHRLLPITGTSDTEILDLSDAAVAGIDGDSSAERLLRARLTGYSAYRRAFGGEGYVLAGMAEQALAEARASGDAATTALVLYNLGAVLLGSPDVARMGDALREFDQIRHLVPEHVDRHDGIRLLGCVALQSGDRAGFNQARRRLSTGAAETQSAFLIAMSTMWSVVDDFLDGRLEAAATTNDILLGQALADPNMMLGWLAQFLVIRTEQDRTSEVLPLAEQMLAEHPELAVLRALVAWVFHEAGQPDRAWDTVDELASQGFAQVGNDWLLATTLAWLTPTVIRNGSDDHVQTLLDRLDAFSGQILITGSATIALGAADHFSGMLLARLGRFDEALRRLEAGGELEERLDAPVLFARSRLEIAQVLRQQGGTGQRADAAKHLEVVRTSAEHLAWPHLRAKASALID